MPSRPAALRLTGHRVGAFSGLSYEGTASGECVVSPWFDEVAWRSVPGGMLSWSVAVIRRSVLGAHGSSVGMSL